MQWSVPRELFLAIIGALIITVFGFSHALLKHPPYAPAVKAEQQSNSGLQAHQGDNAEHGAANNAPPGAPSIGSKSGGGEGQPKAEHSEDEGTEFWPPFLGYRLKVTDTLVAAFTALLFFATIALWLATRRLVLGAEKTSEQQLRAYVWTEARPSHNLDDPTFGVGAIASNSGQTPAYEVHAWSNVLPIAEPLPSGFVFPEAPKHMLGARYVVNPSSQHFMHSKPDEPLTLEERIAIRDGLVILYFWGEVRYRDTSERAGKRGFDFAWVSKPDTAAIGPIATKETMQTNAAHAARIRTTPHLRGDRAFGPVAFAP